MKATTIALAIVATTILGCGNPVDVFGDPLNVDSDSAVDGGQDEGTDITPDVDSATPDVGEDTDAGTDSDVPDEYVPDGDAQEDVVEEPDAAPVCTPDTTRCTGLAVETCNADGTAWEMTKTCPYLCDEGACSGECQPGSSQCAWNDLQICDTQGSWTTTVVCPYVCSNGACAGECVPGSKKCDGLVPQLCEADGHWVNFTACSQMCTAGECAFGCSTGETICNGLQVQVCNANHAWEVTQTCPYACSGGACTGLCVPGATQCSGDSVQMCSTQGQWSMETSCPNTCLNGTCVNCTPGERVCDGTGYKECGSTGMWGAVVPCAGDANASPTCTGAGVCGWTCNPGYADCTSGAGCESNLNDPSTCGSCSNSCDGTNGTPTCTSGTCGITCNPGWANCGSGAGCETPLGTMTNCQACGDSCGSSSLPNSEVTCEPTEGCVTSCEQTWGDCDGIVSNGCEHNVWSDPDNCGACGVTCYGGTCSAGVCSQDLEVVSVSPAKINAVDIDATHVYWSTTGATGPFYIYRAPKAGGPAELLTTTAGQAYPIVVVGSYVVFHDSSTHAINRIPKTGGSISTITSPGYALWDIATDGTNIFWTDADGIPCNCSNPSPDHVYRMPVTGGVQETVATYKYELTGWIEADADRLYVTSRGIWYPSISQYQGGLYYAGTVSTNLVMNSGPTVSTVYDLGQGQYFEQVGDVAVNDTHAFFYVQPNYSGSMVVRVQKGAAVTEKVAEGASSYGFKADTSNFYWTESTMIHRTSVNGSTTETFVSGQLGTNQIRLDDTHAYWKVAGYTGTSVYAIMRAEK